MKKLISIVGPTAVGKTSYAIDLAQKYQTEIISCDSRQFFKELKIGTAMPTKEELSLIPHHFIGNKSIIENYNVGDYEIEALNLVENLFKKYDILILVGGSGLYEKALTFGLDDLPQIPKEIRTEINKDFEKFGLEFIQNELKIKDFEYYSKIDIQNPHRIIRALEIIQYTKKSILFYQNQPKKQRNFLVEKIGLNLNRENLYNKINLRVDQMMKLGLLDEVKSLINFQNKNALKTVGYQELFDYLNNKISLDFAVEEIKKNSRRYAKRQLTWFKKDELIKWIEF